VKKKVLIVEDQFVEANDLQLMLEKAGYEVCGIARSVPIAQEIIQKEKPELVLLDIFLKGKLTGIDLARQLRADNVAFIYLSANSNEEILSAAKITEPYGFIVKPFREKDLLVTLEIARYRYEHSIESRYRREVNLARRLAEVAADKTEWTEKLLQAGMSIQQEIPFDYMVVSGADHMVSFLRIGFNDYQMIGPKELLTMSGLTFDGRLGNEKTAAFFNDGAFGKILRESPLTAASHKTFQMNSLLSFPIQSENGENFIFRFYGRREDTYNSEHLNLVQRLQPTLAKIIEVRSGGETSDESTDNGSRSRTVGFEGIIGTHHLLLNVFDYVTQVAPFDTVVLIQGESGTGKERIADCIHNLSSRKGKPFVKINCATLPANLIESELFGHEKGAFTGAIAKRVGKFDQANGGTIFLDEIGELPLDLQVKLLRVIQEKEIEPIGGRSSVKINVRVIAATNRNLEKEVGEGRFRLDLYYRLNVFPITLPSLRERIEDVPALARHFVDIYNRKSGKKISGLSDRVLKMMSTHSWPGNIRELENVIERSVLLAKGAIIEEVALMLNRQEGISINPQDIRMKTIHENEREYIITVLKKCNGKIWGNGGASEALNLPPSTLKSKMKKLGIRKEDVG
jgi:DNA-binding NtrC family response regulator